jgi:hypothetical protein
MMSKTTETDEAGKATRTAAFIGDGLVPLHSALGIGKTETDSLASCTRWTGYAMNHVDLLKNAALQGAMRTWLRAVAAP